MKCWKCGYAIAHGEDDGLAYATNPPQYAHAQCRERGKDLRIAELEASLSGAMREKAGMVEALFNDDARVAELEAEVARLRRVLGEISRWREIALAYDDDMDHERRSFSDDEEWDMVEKHARISIEEVKK